MPTRALLFTIYTSKQCCSSWGCIRGLLSLETVSGMIGYLKPNSLTSVMMEEPVVENKRGQRTRMEWVRWMTNNNQPSTVNSRSSVMRKEDD
jgi:hypothetical protein